MLDGGAGVNTVPEDTIVAILNEQEALGISLNDKRHLIKQFERRKIKEELRGVAGGKTVTLIGGVVQELKMLEVGSQRPTDARRSSSDSRSVLQARQIWLR